MKKITFSTTLYCRRCNLAFIAKASQRCQCKVAKLVKK